MEVTGEASDGEQAVAVVSRLRPDVVVMDIQMPGVSGIEATRRIKRLLPIGHPGSHCARQQKNTFLESSRRGPLLSHQRDHQQGGPSCHQSSTLGESILSEQILKKLLDYALQFPNTNQADTRGTTLTERELDILTLAAKGLSNKTIASRLCLRENTVKKYMMSGIDKLGVHSRTAAVITAQQRGLLISDG
jgi:DNA-binding NarL/FixJ family response regulator